MIFDDEQIQTLKNRLVYAILFISFFFLSIVARLFYLQVLAGEKYLKMAEEVVVREDEVVARRGKILDRHGQVIADTKVYFEVTLTKQYTSNLEAVVKNVAKILSIDAEPMFETVKNAKDNRKYHPIPILEDVPFEWAAKLSEYLNESYQGGSEYDLSGVDVEAYPVRRYLYPEMFSHVLGYLSEINRDQLNDRKNFPELYYSRGDWIGANGLEKQYDLNLKGIDGKKVRVVDARGKEVPFNHDVQVLKEKISRDPEAGLHLQTTLDFFAQQAAMENFPEGKRGAVVAIEPQTGEVLALYSHPGFDGNKLVQNVDADYWKVLIQEKVLYNLATQGVYPPASTYKPIGVIAGIEAGMIDPEKTKHRCSGGHRFGRRYYRCWKKSGHGIVDTVLSLGQSCDVFFYKVGMELGIDRLSKIAEQFGFNHKTGIDLPSEKSGHIPNWQNRKNMMESDVLSLVIGQSYNQVTPLQLAKMVSMIANGGFEVRPHLVTKLLNHNGETVRVLRNEKKKTDLVDHAAMEWVKKGMIEVVHGRGTAKKLKQSEYKIAGKTGTAQVFRYDQETKKLVELDDHALFVGFAPYDNPEIAVAVVVEHGKGGSRAAAPVAMAVIDSYLDHKKKEEVDDVEHD